jgi:hypothetical protein
VYPDFIAIFCSILIGQMPRGKRNRNDMYKCQILELTTPSISLFPPSHTRGGAARLSWVLTAATEVY